MSNKRARNLVRRPKNKEPRQDILIVVEGETEYNYFKSLKKSLKLPTTKVEVVDGKGGSPLVIVKKAKDLSDNNEYDQIYCVFDGDKPTEYKQALAQAKKYKNFTAIQSIPCFEFWFLLHYGYTTQPFYKCKDVISELKKDGVKDYDKSKDMYSLLETKLKDAIARAKRLEKYHEEQQTLNIYCANPLTKVHQLVKYLQDQKDYKTTKN